MKLRGYPVRIKLLISVVALLAVTACTDSDTGSDVKKAVETTKTEVAKPVEDVTKEVVDTAKSELTKAKDTVASKASEIKADVVAKATEAQSSVAAKVSEMKNEVVAKAVEVKDSAVTTATEAKDEVVAKAVEVKESAVTSATEVKDEVVAKAVEVKDSAVTTATEVKDEVVAKAVDVEEAAVTASAELKAATSEGHPGAKVYQTYCMACHVAEGKAVIAPPIFAVKDHVIKAYPERDAFIARVVSWAKAPNGDDLLMPGAAKKFGVMPAMPYLADADLNAVAEFLYDTDLGKPDWYKAHYEAEHGKAN